MALTEHIMQAVATAALLGSGTMLLSTRVDVARQDERILRIEKLDQKLDTISADVSTTKASVARLEARLDASQENRK